MFFSGSPQSLSLNSLTSVWHLCFCTGVITRYEVYLHGPMESQNLSSFAVEKKVFSSDWLDPSVPPTLQTNGSTLWPPESSTTVADLQAFSTYQMRVVSVNIAGSVTSGWTTARTMEGGLYGQSSWFNNFTYSSM